MMRSRKDPREPLRAVLDIGLPRRAGRSRDEPPETEFELAVAGVETLLVGVISRGRRSRISVDDRLAVASALSSARSLLAHAGLSPDEALYLDALEANFRFLSCWTG